MKVIRQSEAGDIDVLSEVDIPIPKPGRNEVLVKIHAIGLNPADFKMRSGAMSAEYPLILGAEFCGAVAAKGDLVRDVEIGDRIYGLSCMQASNGSYAEYTCVPANMIAKAPDNLSNAEAAAVPIAYLTAFEAILSRGVLQENRPLFIAGASGGVGSAALSLIQAHHGGPVFTLAGSKGSAAYLKERFGIPESQIVYYQGLSIEQTAEQLCEKNGGMKFYLAVDFVGRKAKELCLDVADFNGHVVSILPEDEHFPIEFWGRKSGPIWKKSLSVHMVNILGPGQSPNSYDWVIYSTVLKHLTELFEAKEISPPVVESLGELSLKTIQEAHLRLEEGHTKGKLTLEVSDSKAQ